MDYCWTSFVFFRMILEPVLFSCLSSYVINNYRNVLAFVIQVENKFGSVGWSTLDAGYETITRQGLFWWFYIFADSTGTARSFSQLFQGWLILQTGSSFQFCMGNVSLSIVALCHAKTLPELETWFRYIIIGSRERGKLDNSTLEFWGF